MIKRAPPHGSIRRIESAPQSKSDAAVTTYLVILRDRETQTVVGYYDGAWTTDRRRAARMRPSIGGLTALISRDVSRGTEASARCSGRAAC